MHCNACQDYIPISLKTIIFHENYSNRIEFQLLLRAGIICQYFSLVNEYAYCILTSMYFEDERLRILVIIV